MDSVVVSWNMCNNEVGRLLFHKGFLNVILISNCCCILVWILHQWCFTNVVELTDTIFIGPAVPESGIRMTELGCEFFLCDSDFLGKIEEIPRSWIHVEAHPLVGVWQMLDVEGNKGTGIVNLNSLSCPDPTVMFPHPTDPTAELSCKVNRFYNLLIFLQSFGFWK